MPYFVIVLLISKHFATRCPFCFPQRMCIENKMETDLVSQTIFVLQLNIQSFCVDERMVKLTKSSMLILERTERLNFRKML